MVEHPGLAKEKVKWKKQIHGYPPEACPCKGRAHAAMTDKKQHRWNLQYALCYNKLSCGNY
jgi:hypothetical protein